MKCPFPYTKQDGMQFPCGKCIWCLKRRAAQWGFRLEQEEKASSGAFFLTLTYDNDHVPISENGFMTLNQRHMQLFFKRLRKHHPGKIRYFYAGEYGSKGDRPHYHAIVFGLDLKHMIGEANYKKHLAGIPLDGKTPYHPQAWGYGEITIGQVQPGSIAYTLKYITKPCGIPRFKNDDRVKTFQRQSKGLGLNYLTPAIRRYHDHETTYHLTNAAGHRIALPRYYKDKIWKENPQRREEISWKASLLTSVDKPMTQDRLDRLKLFSTLKKG